MVRRAPFAAAIVIPLLLGGCTVVAVPTPRPSPSPAPVETLSPEALAIPTLTLTMDGREIRLAGYDPTWPEERARDRRLILQLAPRITVERGRTYPITLTWGSIDPATGWLPPDFGHIGGSEPVRTADGFVPEVPTSAFVREDALPDFEAGMFGVKAETRDGQRVFAYPAWILEPDSLPADVFAGFRLGISDEDGATAARTFVAHIQDDLRRGGGPAAASFATREALEAAFEAGELDAWIAIPPAWSDNPTTHNGFASGSADPETGNAATDTGGSYLLASLIDRALGPAGLIIDRGF